MIWSDHDTAILREHYPAGGAKAVQPRLEVPRDINTINQAAWRKGIKVAGRKQYEKFPPSDTVDAAIRRAYQSGKRGAVKELANRLGREYGWIKHRACELGLRKMTRRGPNWSAAEDALLESLEGKAVSVIYRTFRRAGFNRTQAGIQSHLYELGLSTNDPDTLTASGVAQVLGVDMHAVLRWIRTGALTAKRYHQTHQDTEPRAWRIKRGALRNFIRDHPTEVDLRKVNQLLFLELMLGAPRRWEREESA